MSMMMIFASFHEVCHFEEDYLFFMVSTRLEMFLSRSSLSLVSLILIQSLKSYSVLHGIDQFDSNSSWVLCNLGYIALTWHPLWILRPGRLVFKWENISVKFLDVICCWYHLHAKDDHRQGCHLVTCLQIWTTSVSWTCLLWPLKSWHEISQTTTEIQTFNGS